jgi:organic radical activating enzyme
LKVEEKISAHVLPLMEDFYTIQGEGFYQGYAAYFIRLGGCDVGCVWFDVKESWDAAVHPLVSVEWSKEKEMLALIIDFVKANPKWKVSLQIHKYMNIP